MHIIVCQIVSRRTCNEITFFFARAAAYMQSALGLYAIARPSVCLSHGWIGQKRLKLESCKVHHRVAQSL